MRAEDREAKGERFILELIDWEENGDPHFYEHHHLVAAADRGVADRTAARSPGSSTTPPKFSGKKLVVRPGRLVS